jgi:cytochrome P450
MASLPAPPRVPGLPLLGNTLRLLRDPLGFLTEAAREYGDVVDVNVRLMRIYLVSRPELIDKVLVADNRAYVKDEGTHALRALLGEGLLTSEGDHWRRQRRLAQPGFHRERVASYGAVMVEYTERMLSTFRDGDVRNIHEDMMRLTREIVAKTLFDADLTRESASVGEAFEVVVRRFAEVPPGIPVIDRIPTPGQRRYRRAVETLDAMIYRLINERRASGHDAGDLLSMLMGARDEDGGGRMSDRELRDEAITLFLAGHETTALVLSFAWLLLSQNPEVEAKLAFELEEALGGRPPAVSDIPKLRYVDWVIHETMRLYPPAWAIGREALEDREIGGFHVPKGTQVWTSQWVTQRDPRYFEDPEAFRPERWSGDLAKRIPKYAYYPFGGGPRLCIGASFALMEATLLLATIAQKVRLIALPDHPIRLVTGVTLRPKYGVRVAVKRR